MRVSGRRTKCMESAMPQVGKDVSTLEKALSPEGRQQVIDALGRLFGAGWDSIVKWLVVGFAGSWFWVSAVPEMTTSSRDSGFRQGPVDWGIGLAESLGFPVPQWLLDIPIWMEAPERSWAVAWLPVIAAVCATCLAKARRSSGFVVVGIASLLLSVQESKNFVPIGTMMLFAAIPAAIALLIAVIQHFTPTRGAERVNHFFLETAVVYYGLFGMAILWQPLVAPALVVVGLVGMYGRALNADEPAERLASDALRRVRKSGKSLAEANAVDVLGVLSGLALSEPQARQRMAWSLFFDNDSPTGSVVRGRD